MKQAFEKCLSVRLEKLTTNNSAFDCMQFIERKPREVLIKKYAEKNILLTLQFNFNNGKCLASRLCVVNQVWRKSDSLMGWQWNTNLSISNLGN